MKEELINEIERQMLPYLNNEQLLRLQDVLSKTMSDLNISEGELPTPSEDKTLEAFISAKRIEGCSEKTLNYYLNTIEAMVSDIGKPPQRIMTDDLRRYLTEYQCRRKSSKVTIDNIRRILSSFFSCQRLTKRSRIEVKTTKSSIITKIWYIYFLRLSAFLTPSNIPITVPNTAPSMAPIFPTAS